MDESQSRDSVTRPFYRDSRKLSRDSPRFESCYSGSGVILVGYRLILDDPRRQFPDHDRRLTTPARLTIRSQLISSSFGQARNLSKCDSSKLVTIHQTEATPQAYPAKLVSSYSRTHSIFVGHQPICRRSSFGLKNWRHIVNIPDYL